MSTIKSVEGAAANSATGPIDDTTAISPTYERRDLPEKLHKPFWKIIDKRNDIAMLLEDGEKHGALTLLASLRTDFLAFCNLVKVGHNDEQVCDNDPSKEDRNQSHGNDPSKEKATAPASRADILALQKQIEQLCNASKQDATSPETTENDLRAEVASLKETVAELGATVKKDKDEQRVALERVKAWSKLFRERLPAFLDEVWDATKEPKTQPATFPKDEDEDDTHWSAVRAAWRRVEMAKPAAVRAEMSATRARRAAGYVKRPFLLFLFG